MGGGVEPKRWKAPARVNKAANNIQSTIDRVRAVVLPANATSIATAAGKTMNPE